jgi:hypothetical protein
MRNRLKQSAVLVAVMVGLMPSAAFANRSLNTTPGGALTGTSSGVATFYEEEAMTFTNAITLVGSIHRAIPKVIGWLVGMITSCRGTLAETTFSEVRLAFFCELSLPWHIRYNGFEGTLPNVSALRLIILNLSFRMRDLLGGIFFDCLFRSDLPVRGSGARTGEIDRITLVPTLFPGVGGEEGCRRRSIELRTLFNITPAQTLRLV